MPCPHGRVLLPLSGAPSPPLPSQATVHWHGPGPRRRRRARARRRPGPPLHPLHARRPPLNTARARRGPFCPRRVRTPARPHAPRFEARAGDLVTPRRAARSPPAAPVELTPTHHAARGAHGRRRPRGRAGGGGPRRARGSPRLPGSASRAAPVGGQRTAAGAPFHPSPSPPSVSLDDRAGARGAFPSPPAAPTRRARRCARGGAVTA
jgi:hypothetical protein